VRASALLALLFALSFATFPAVSQPADTLVEQAKTLLAGGDARAAYALLEPHEAERSGDPQFDYLLGIAALDSGRLTRAVFALERVLAVQPDNALARAEIARAYFLLGERDTAKGEFQAVERMGVPAGARATLQKFLSAIEQLEARARTQLRAYVELGAGYDSNVNSAASTAQVAVPLFGGALFTLTPASIEAHDTFVSLGAGANLRHPLSLEAALLGGVSVNKRINSTEDRFDTGFVDGNAGLSWAAGKHAFTAALQGNNYYLDNRRLRDAYGGTAQWQYNLDSRNQFTVYTQYSELHYPGQEIRDARRYVAGGAYARAFAWPLQPVAYASAYGGEERERRAGVPHLGHELAGLRLGAQIRPQERVTLFANASVERRRYGGPDPFFLAARRDRQYDLRVGINYVPAKNWVVSPLVSVVRNESNIAINDFSREIYSVVVRREF
jgi:outer membrane protein